MQQKCHIRQPLQFPICVCFLPPAELIVINVVQQRFNFFQIFFFCHDIGPFPQGVIFRRGKITTTANFYIVENEAKIALNLAVYFTPSNARFSFSIKKFGFGESFTKLKTLCLPFCMSESGRKCSQFSNFSCNQLLWKSLSIFLMSTLFVSVPRFAP